mgnify:CR=1 FL=1
MAHILSWEGDGLSNGVLTTASAGIGDTAPTQINLKAATATIVSAGGRAPAIQLQETSVGSSAWVGWSFDPSTTVALRLYFTPTTTLATTHAIFSLRDSSQTRIADVIITSAGAVRVYDVDNAYQAIGGNGTITVGTTYRFEMTLDTITGTLNIAIYNGHSSNAVASQEAVAGNFIIESAGYFRLGKNTTTQQAETQLWDDIVLTTDQIFIGPAVIVTTISAGSDQVQIEPFSTVTLTGSVLTGSVTAWNWLQLSGPSVALTGTGNTRTFLAPANTEVQNLAFQVIGDGSATDTVNIEVNPHLEWIKTNDKLVALRTGIVTH